MMEKLFETPISTSNLYAPDFDSLWSVFSTAFNESEQLVTGTLVAELERQLCVYHDSKFCVTFSTGFWALVAAIRIKAISGRSEVIIPSLTYRRLADAVFWSDHVPVIVDVQPQTLSICPAAVESMITENTALILGVHPIINCCDVERLMAVADQRKIPIVFDAVESVHETIGGKRVGSFGVGEVFSFHASKLINGLEGGYVCTDHEQLRNKLIEFRGQNAAGNDIAASRNCPVGFDGTLNDVHAAFAIAGLQEIEQNVAHNKQIYQAYASELSSIQGINLLAFHTAEQTSFKNVVAQVTGSFPLSRDELVAALNEQGVLARAYYDPPLHAKKHGFPVRVGDVENSSLAASRFINLPCGYRVSKKDVVKVCQYLQLLAGT